MVAHLEMFLSNFNVTVHVWQEINFLWNMLFIVPCRGRFFFSTWLGTMKINTQSINVGLHAYTEICNVI